MTGFYSSAIACCTRFGSFWAVFPPPTEKNQLWTIIKENAADKTSINQVTINLRDEKGKLISHAACKRNDETFSLLMESSFDIKEPTDKILELMDPLPQ